MHCTRRITVTLALAIICAAFAGCGMTHGNPATAAPMAAISGNVHGGQQPISGAQVYLYAAGNSGYGSAPTSLLNSPGYVTTDASGNFSITGDYSLSACQSANDLVYLVSVGGNPGAGSDNPNSVLMTTLGACGNISSGTFVMMNEVTTVASVYALQQFMSPGTYNVGTTSTNLTGLQNAFLTVPNLVDLNNTGYALATTPAGNGAVAQSQLNSLANILASCVNSVSPFAACASLYTAATPTGGTAPADTLGAILDIALNPGNNVATLYNLPPPAIAFSPALTAQPNDWTLGLYYFSSTTYNPTGVAIDHAGDLWISSTYYGPTQFTPAGTLIPANPSIAANLPGEINFSISITPTGNLWITQTSTNAYLFTGAGTFLNAFSSGCDTAQTASDASGTLYVVNGYACSITQSGTPTSLAGSNRYATSVAIDATGDPWLPSTEGTIFETSSTGSLVSSETASGWTAGPVTNNTSQGVAIDAQGDAWMRYYLPARTTPQYGLVEISPSGQTLASTSLLDQGANAVAIDGANTIWVPNYNGSISHFSHTGAAISPATGYQNSVPYLQGAFAINDPLATTAFALDSSGNAWATSHLLGIVMEWVGVAAPVTTPISQNLVNNSIGQRP